ncbi:MAG TPA: serine--tRNA ligase, partial [Stellaceae bacterium]|nr:serine--tRNA ligase [Stellaceae bacterium]
MIDLKWIRENPEAYDRGLASRGLPPRAREILALDAARRAAQTAWQELQAQRNELSRLVGEAKRQHGDATALMVEVQSLKEALALREA